MTDAVTRQPVKGARVHGVHETVAPAWSDFWFRQAALPTDARGVTALAPSTENARYTWTIVRAEGYAPSGTFWTPQPDTPVEVELWPVVPSRIKLLDFTGAPLGLVHLGVAVGCGHTPDVTSAVTDSLGRATLLAVGREGWEIADVHPVGETVRATYLDVDWEAANEDVYETMAAPGARLDGVLPTPRAPFTASPWASPTRTAARGPSPTRADASATSNRGLRPPPSARPGGERAHGLREDAWA